MDLLFIYNLALNHILESKSNATGYDGFCKRYHTDKEEVQDLILYLKYHIKFGHRKGE